VGGLFDHDTSYNEARIREEKKTPFSVIETFTPPSLLLANGGKASTDYTQRMTKREEREVAMMDGGGGKLMPTTPA
jgi:hypothetical protein